MLTPATGHLLSIGFEASAIYGEESKDPKRTVPRATYLAIVAITALLFVLEKEWGFSFQSTKRVTYEKIELITPVSIYFSHIDLAQLGLYASTPVSWSVADRRAEHVQ